MEVRCEEHTVTKNTDWGPVQKSLNQHRVFVNDRLAGYVGVTHFLPLCGFPQELVESVAAECSKLLNKPVLCGDAPPSVNQLVTMLETAGVADGED